MLTLAQFCERIFGLLEVPVPDPLDPHLGLFDDLGLDSLQAFELVVGTEQLAGRDVPPPEVPALWTVADAYRYYVDSAAAADESVV